MTQDFAQRAVDFCKRWLTWSIWLQLIRRDFIVENKLRFVGIALEDIVFTMCEICSASRYLVVPNVIYFHHKRKSSLIWNNSGDVEKFLHSRMTMIKDGVRYLDEYLSGLKTFANRPDLKYMLFNMFMQDISDHLIRIYLQVPAFALDALLRKEFSEGDNIAPASFAFSQMNVYRLQLIKAQRRLAELEVAAK